MMRAARTFAVLATMALAVACRTVTDPLPSQATLNFDITDSAVASQRLPLPAPQVVSWKIDEMTASNVPGVGGSYSFLYSGPCFYQYSAAAPLLFSVACRTSGLTLAPGTSISSATLRVKLSTIEVRVASRPDLSSLADPDGDGIPNISDNCPIIYNPDQANTNAGLETFLDGDACSDPDSSGALTVADQDQDGVSDAADDCSWYPNPIVAGETSQADSNRDGIGDACERTAPVALPGGSVTIQCDNVAFVTQGSKIALFRLDFGRPGVLTCDAGFTGCILDPSVLKLSLAGTTTTFDCKSVVCDANNVCTDAP